MYKPITLFFFLIFSLFTNVLKAQDPLEQGQIENTKRGTKIVGVVTLDGKTVSVKIIPDYVHNELRIILMKDTLRVDGFWGFWTTNPDIQLLNKSFLRINYAVRGGSNLTLENVIVVCVNKDKIYPALHCLKYSKWDAQDTRDYHIKLSIGGYSKSNYKLKVNVHDDANSPSRPEENYTYNNETILSFDVRNNAFYSVKQVLYENFVMKAKGKASIKQELNGTVPSVILGRMNYYLVGRKWYATGRSGELYISPGQASTLDCRNL